MTAGELFDFRLAAMLGVPHPDFLKELLTDEQWSDWELFYSADPWGELRQDMRAVATLHNTLNPNTEIKMFHPYFDESDEVDDEARYQDLQAQLAAIGPETIQERLKAGREAHLAKKSNGK